MSASQQDFKDVCPYCQGEVEFPAEEAGQQVVCPHCWKIVTLNASHAATPGRFPERILGSAVEATVLHKPRRATAWVVAAAVVDDQ